MKDTKALVSKTTKYEKPNEKSIVVLERWTLISNELIKTYPYVGDSFDSAANEFDRLKKHEQNIVCLRIVQLVLTEFLITIRVDEIALWIVTTDNGNNCVKDFLQSMESVPLGYFLGYGSREE